MRRDRPGARFNSGFFLFGLALGGSFAIIACWLAVIGYPALLNGSDDSRWAAAIAPCAAALAFVVLSFSLAGVDGRFISCGLMIRISGPAMSVVSGRHPLVGAALAALIATAGACALICALAAGASMLEQQRFFSLLPHGAWGVHAAALLGGVAGYCRGRHEILAIDSAKGVMRIGTRSAHQSVTVPISSIVSVDLRPRERPGPPSDPWSDLDLVLRYSDREGVPRHTVAASFPEYCLNSGLGDFVDWLRQRISLPPGEAAREA